MLIAITMVTECYFLITMEAMEGLGAHNSVKNKDNGQVRTLKQQIKRAKDQTMQAQVIHNRSTFFSCAMLDYYHNLAKEHPLLKECAPPILAQFPVQAQGLFQVSTYPGVSFAWLIENTREC